MICMQHVAGCCWLWLGPGRVDPFLWLIRFLSISLSLSLSLFIYLSLNYLTISISQPKYVCNANRPIQSNDIDHHCRIYWPCTFVYIYVYLGQIRSTWIIDLCLFNSKRFVYIFPISWPWILYLFIAVTHFWFGSLTNFIGFHIFWFLSF